MHGHLTEAEAKELYDEAYGDGPTPAWRIQARKKARAARRAHLARFQSTKPTS